MALYRIKWVKLWVTLVVVLGFIALWIWSMSYNEKLYFALTGFWVGFMLCFHAEITPKKTQSIEKVKDSEHA